MLSAYLDNNATTRLDPRVLDAMSPFFLEDYGNASSIHGFGQKARAAVESAREQVAWLLKARPEEVIFTSGGTESDNTALRGVAALHSSRGKHIVTTTIEHPAVLRMCEQLEKEGFRISRVGVDEDGVVRLEELKETLAEDTILVSVMYVNNEVGSIQPLQEIARWTRGRGILFHTDAVQAVGKISVDVQELGVDLLSLSGHKFHGPKGTGALWVRKGVDFQPLMVGGTHEKRRRAGTQNVPGIVGLGKACQIAVESLEDFQTRVRRLRDRLESEILQKIPGTVVNGTVTRRAPHVTNISFEHVQGEALLVALDFEGIAVSTGAACSSGSVAPSHVLTAMGLTPERVEGAIRFSLSRMTTQEEVDATLRVLPGIVTRMRELTPVPRV